MSPWATGEGAKPPMTGAHVREQLVRHKALSQLLKFHRYTSLYLHQLKTKALPLKPNRPTEWMAPEVQLRHRKDRRLVTESLADYTKTYLSCTGSLHSRATSLLDLSILHHLQEPVMSPSLQIHCILGSRWPRIPSGPIVF